MVTGVPFPVPPIPYDVVVDHVRPRQLAAATASAASNANLGPLIIGLLNNVWPLLRSQGVKTGHNVVVYYAGSPLRLAAGVEVYGEFEPTDVVQPVTTPAGEAATTAHWGEYTALRGAYDALERWCAASNRQLAGTSWEVYGDWHDDPAQVRTDVYMLLEPDRGEPVGGTEL